MNQLKKDVITVWGYSLTHGLIDLASALVVYNVSIVHGLPPVEAFMLTIMYDLLAFALQPLAGLLIDHLKRARSAMLIGIVLTLTGVLMMRVNALTAIVTVGVGNALFHLGAGAQILCRYPGTASLTGIFVGPGALGLSIGLWFGSLGFFPLWPLAIVLIVTCAGLAFLPPLSHLQPHSHMLSGAEDGSGCRFNSQPGVVLLLFTAIVVRGFVGRTGFAELPSNGFVIIGLGAAACIGKIAGGVIADRFGWSSITLVGLVLAGIGIIFVSNHVEIAFITMALFQMTMPITLVATSEALPGKPAFAFGLTCLALVTGTLFSYCIPQDFTKLPFTLVLIGISGGCIIMALWQMGYLRTLLQPKHSL